MRMGFLYLYIRSLLILMHTSASIKCRDRWLVEDGELSLFQYRSISGSLLTLVHTSASIKWLDRWFVEDSEVRLEQDRQPSESDLLHVDCLAHLETYADQLGKHVKLPSVQVHTHTNTRARALVRAHTPNAHLYAPAQTCTRCARGCNNGGV